MNAPVDRLNSALADRYRIERELGAGGMATVYLAHDLRHARSVALKVLRPELAAVLGAERFLAEIRTTANLQHPHILGLIDSGQADGLVYYVMPYVAGESLRDRLKQEKQLPVDDAIRVAREVALALDYAHRQGIVHRDIKPENILLQDGQAMVADFGIALAASAAGEGRMTETGMSLGTPQYMSPEQAMGEREITPRSDIYSLGCVLYEMLTGEPPFSGPTIQAIVAKVMAAEPEPVTTLRRTVPGHVAAAIQVALEKVPADRFKTALEFAEALATPGKLSVGRLTAGPRRRRWVAWTAGLAVAVGGMALGWILKPGATLDPVPVEFLIEPDSVAFSGDLAIAPNGGRIAFGTTHSNGTSQLYLRDLASAESVPIPGTEEGGLPMFSPDGGWLAFVVGVRLQKVRLQGGEPVVIATLPTAPTTGHWGRDGSIVLAARNIGAPSPEPSLYRVPAEGGPISPLLEPDSSSFLWVGGHSSDGNDVLLAKAPLRDIRRPILGVFSLKSRTFTSIGVIGVPIGYLSSSEVVYATYDGSAWTQRLERRPAKLTGEPRQLIKGVQVVLNRPVVTVASNGLIAFEQSTASSLALVDVDRTGQESAVASLGAVSLPRYSPDGRRIALVKPSSSGSDLWVYSLPDQTTQRITNGWNAVSPPSWSPDGKRLIVAGGPTNPILVLINTESTDSLRPLLLQPSSAWSPTFASGGQRIVFVGLGSSSDILDILANGGEPRALIATDASESNPDVSPDGRWMAYTSDASGRTEVYVTSYPEPGRRHLVSAGGDEPVWSPSGKELFYRSGTAMIAVSVETNPSLHIGERRVLFDRPYASAIGRNYDVHPGGNHFLFVKSGAGRRLVVRTNGLDPSYSRNK